jgi:hypothetical protein
MKRSNLILGAMFSLVFLLMLVLPSAIFEKGDQALAEEKSGSRGGILVYTDKDVVRYGDTITIFIENVGEASVCGWGDFWIKDYSGEVVYHYDGFHLLIEPPCWEPGEKISFDWTCGVLPGDYCVFGVISSRDISDFYNAGQAKFTVWGKGDFNEDGKVNIIDLFWFAKAFGSKCDCFTKAFGSKCGEPNYDRIGDFNDDGKIDLYDLWRFAHVYEFYSPLK